ncbi:uncharacterized protein LOC141616841 [Silene latifolia]|uniref:uncharacterized protein LOC141616841 n=1 Tax=Silene latifolia TaxID=37657 RepID=UPI003D787898
MNPPPIENSSLTLGNPGNSADSVTYNTIIQGFIVNEDFQNALCYRDIMVNEGFEALDKIVFTSLLADCACQCPTVRSTSEADCSAIVNSYALPNFNQICRVHRFCISELLRPAVVWDVASTLFSDGESCYLEIRGALCGSGLAQVTASHIRYIHSYAGYPVDTSPFAASDDEGCYLDIRGALFGSVLALGSGPFICRLACSALRFLQRYDDTSTSATSGHYLLFMVGQLLSQYALFVGTPGQCTSGVVCYLWVSQGVDNMPTFAVQSRPCLQFPRQVITYFTWWDNVTPKYSIISLICFVCWHPWFKIRMKNEQEKYGDRLMFFVLLILLIYFHHRLPFPVESLYVEFLIQLQLLRTKNIGLKFSLQCRLGQGLSYSQEEADVGQTFC